MSRQVIRVKDGVVTGLFSDSIDFRRMIGPSMRVERASNVEYDNVRCGWTVQLADGPYLAAVEGFVTGVAVNARVFPTRAEALAAEVEFLQTKLRG